MVREPPPPPSFVFWLSPQFSRGKNTENLYIVWSNPGGRGVEKFGRDVRPLSQNPYPLYEQNLQFSLPYLWPDQKFDTLFMTWLLDH